MIVELWEEIQKLKKRLEKKPKKTLWNSSLPPSQGFKAETKSEEKGSNEQRVGSIGREGGGRQLSENLDQSIKATVKSCAGCGKEITESMQILMERYDKIDIPSIKSIVMRIERYRYKCEGCGQQQIAGVPIGMEAGDDIFSGRMKMLLLRSLLLRRRWADLAENTRYQYRCRLYRDLDTVVSLLPTQEDGLRLQKRYLDLRGNFFLFLDDPTIPPTNNASEQALRWSVIFRKITNGFRSNWGRDIFAMIRSIVNTGKRQGLSTFESILAALNPLKSLFPIG